MKIEIENSIVILICIVIVLLIAIGVSFVILNTNHTQDNNVVVNNTHNVSANNTTIANNNSNNGDELVEVADGVYQKKSDIYAYNHGHQQQYPVYDENGHEITNRD